VSHHIQLKPRPLRKPGLFFESNERPSALRPGSLATAPRYLYLEDFRESGTTRDSGHVRLYRRRHFPPRPSRSGSAATCQAIY
jgi:hypothetical protein